MSIKRALRFLYLKDVKRPVQHLQEADMVANSEKRTDELVSAGFKLALNLKGLKSYKVPTSYGLMNCYDTHPGSNLPPLIMLHGIGSSGQCFSWLALMLREKRRVVCPDLFHFSGFSRANNPVMNLHQHFTSIVEFIQHLGHSEVDFCGLSLGGWIGLKLAIEKPEMVKSLFLLNPAGLSYRAQYLRETLTHLTWKKFRLLYPGLMRAYPYTGIPLASPVLRRSMYRLLKDDAVRNFIKLLQAEDFIDGKLTSIKAPCLLLWGKEDRLISEKTPYTLVNEIPNCTAFHVEKCAHVLCLEAPLNVYDALLSFYNITDRTENKLTKLLRITSKVYKQTALRKKETGALNECI